MRMGGDSAPGRFDEHPAQVPPTLFGERAIVVGFAAVMDASAQPGIADQLPGGGETADVADGGQNGQRRNQRKAGQLDQERRRCAPGLTNHKVLVEVNADETGEARINHERLLR
jgi:hypothetical protein